ncbi:hypothetical protein MTO96_045334 [Rhipicephalus appendiculatus]
MEEDMMDQADAEATSGGSSDPPALQEKSDLKASGECQPSGKKDVSPDGPRAEASTVRPKVVATKGEVPRSSSEVDATEEPVEGMDLTGASAKRPRDPSEGGDGCERGLR